MLVILNDCCRADPISEAQVCSTALLTRLRLTPVPDMSSRL